MRSLLMLALSLFPASLCACTAPAVPIPAERSILAGSTPAAGSAVEGPVNSLDLRFDPPARLLEVSVTDGSGQVMPMMVTAVGEVGHYSLPLSGLEAGRYSVNWRASVGASEYRGSFAFAVR